MLFFSLTVLVICPSETNVVISSETLTDFIVFTIFPLTLLIEKPLFKTLSTLSKDNDCSLQFDKISFI